MTSELEKIAIEHGDRLKVIPIGRLRELKKIIDNFKIQEELNNFQKWIVNELYQFGATTNEFPVNSIILIASNHPFYANVDFVHNGEKKTFLSLVRSDFNKIEKYVKDFMRKNGYFIIQANNLPLKRLGVHSGLAKYGRNNITYVDGLGSNFSYLAFFSDLVCEKDTWGEIKNAETCDSCNLCIEGCPTKAIRKDRFLINNQKCLSAVNELPGDFPDWVPKDIHHTLYDCLICQRVCPMNRKQLTNIVESICFNEDETNKLLLGEPIETFSEELKLKVNKLGLNDWYEAIPRNLKVLLEK